MESLLESKSDPLLAVIRYWQVDCIRCMIGPSMQIQMHLIPLFHESPESPQIDFFLRGDS